MRYEVGQGIRGAQVEHHPQMAKKQLAIDEQDLVKGCFMQGDGQVDR